MDNRKRIFGSILIASRPLLAVLFPVFFAFLAFDLFLIERAYCQVKYSPEHPEVEAMARRGIQFLEAHPHGDHGQATLAAITVIEFTKRYEQEVPVDHPLVHRGITYVLSDLEKHAAGNKSGLTDGHLYYTCLAAILLSEVGSSRYAAEINTILGILRSRKMPSGAYGYSEDTFFSDSSQSQYVGLALAVTNLHGFEFDPQQAKDLLDWYVRAQQADGSWLYHYSPTFTGSMSNSSEISQSLVVAGGGTVYLLGDILGLNPKSRRNPAAPKGPYADLPPSVSIHIMPKNAKDGEERKDGPKVSFDGGRLSSAKRSANDWIGKNFLINGNRWNYYALYGFERYAYFREVAEGEVKEMPTWYDRGVEHLKSVQSGDGSWGEGSRGETANDATCFAILFLVRSSQILMGAGNEGQVVGALGFDLNAPLVEKKGTMVSSMEMKAFDDVVEMLQATSTEDELDKIIMTLGPAIRQFTEREDVSRGEQMAFFRGLVSDENYNKRFVAVRFLASQQSLDSVPALLFALTDPEMQIAREAHNGLRLVSRKVDAFPLSDNPTEIEFKSLKKQWTEWYLGIRPGAQLFEDIE